MINSDPITRLRLAAKHVGGRYIVAGVDVFAEVERLVDWIERDPQAVRFLIEAISKGDSDEARMWARDCEEAA